MKKRPGNKTISLLLIFAFISIQLSAQQKTAGNPVPKDSTWFTSFDGTKIFYETYGKGKPVLLIHGFIVNSNSWKHTAILKDLIDNGYQVILPDLRGNGQSDKPHVDTAYQNDAEAKDLMALMSHLHVNKYSVVGYSRGSIIAARLLVLDPRISNAVIGGMGTGFTDPQWPRRILFYRALMGDSIPELSGAVEYIHKINADQLALALLQKEQPSTSKETLGKIRQPVLVISGDQDSENGPAKDLAKCFSKSTLATVPGDHNHAAVTPEFSASVITFLKKHSY